MVFEDLIRIVCPSAKGTTCSALELRISEELDHWFRNFVVRVQHYMAGVSICPVNQSTGVIGTDHNDGVCPRINLILAVDVPTELESYTRPNFYRPNAFMLWIAELSIDVDVVS